jgi:hypothetical protein
MTEQISFGLQMKPELLALLLNKDFWNKYKNKIIKGMFPAPLDKLYVTIQSFHDKYDESLDKEKLWELIKIDHPTLTERQRIDLFELVDRIKDCKSWTEEFASTVLTAVWKQEVFRQITELGLKGSQGQVSTLDPLKDIVERHATTFIPKDNFVECSMDLDALIEADKHVPCWDFNLPALQDKIGGMGAGHFLQVMARPDCGKTGSLLSFVAGPKGWAEQGAKVDYYGNEEPIRRTRWRMLSSYTGLTKKKLILEKIAAKTLFNNISNNVRTFDIPFGTPIEQVALRTRDRKPDIVIVDQLDKCSVQPIAGNFVNDTERLRMLYIKFREIAKQYNCLVVGVCQASADAEGQRIVTYDMAENSKTGKAAECDVFLGIGRSPLTMTMQEEDYTRWLTISKNKLDTSWKGSVTCKLIPELSRLVS